MRSIRRTALSAAAVVLAVTLTACSFGDDSEASTTEGSESQEAAEESGESDGSDSKGEAGSAEAAGLDLNDLPDPIASQAIPAVVEGDDDATTTGVDQLGFSLNSSSTEDDWLYGYLGDSGWSAFLVDSQSLREHSVLKKRINRPQTGVQGPEFTPGEAYYALAVFAAPPPDVDD